MFRKQTVQPIQIHDGNQMSMEKKTTKQKSFIQPSHPPKRKNIRFLLGKKFSNISAFQAEAPSLNSFQYSITHHCLAFFCSRGSKPMTPGSPTTISGWWLNQPIWKIFVKLEIFPKWGWKLKKMKPPWNHHLDFNRVYQCLCFFQKEFHHFWNGGWFHDLQSNQGF